MLHELPVITCLLSSDKHIDGIILVDNILIYMEVHYNQFISISVIFRMHLLKALVVKIK